MHARQYIAHQDTKLVTNPFYRSLEDTLDVFISVPTNQVREEDIYVHTRSSSQSKAELLALLERMPTDLQAFYTTEQGQSAIGGDELDLLDCLLNIERNKMLFIPGAVGIGKTTFLHHVLLHLRRTIHSLSHLFPIITDCSAFGETPIDYVDLIFRTRLAIERTIQWIAVSPVEHTRFATLCADHDFTKASAKRRPTLSSLYSFIESFQRILPADTSIVFVLDNLDHCSAKNVAFLCEIAKAVVLAALERLRGRSLVTSPETLDTIEQAEHLKVSIAGEYYKSTLIHDKQYLANAVYDIPLRHARWDQETADKCSSRLFSICELIEAAVEEEYSNVKIAVEEDAWHGSLVLVLREALYSSILLSSLKSLLDDLGSSRASGSHDDAGTISKRLRSVKNRLAEVEMVVARHNSRATPGAAPTPSLFQAKRYRIQGMDQLAIIAPELLEPKKPTKIRVELDLGDYDALSPLILCWRYKWEDKTREVFCDLDRDDTGVHVATIELPATSNAQPLPEANVSVFSRMDPLIICDFPGSRFCPKEAQ